MVFIYIFLLVVFGFGVGIIFLGITGNLEKDKNKLDKQKIRKEERQKRGSCRL